MWYVLLLIAGFVPCSFVLWVLFLASMTLKRGGVNPDAQWVALLVVYLTLAVDAVYTVLYGTIVFLDVPREWTFTERLERYQGTGGWRGRIAGHVCRVLLDWADPAGCHCK
jgi:hypothetical protein